MYFYLFLTIIIRTISDLSFKKSVHHLRFEKTMVSYFNNFVAMFKNPFLWIGGSLAIINLNVWSLCLVKFDLNFAYPFSSISYILIILAGRLFFKERIDIMKLIGILCIALGAIFLISGAK